MPLYGWTSPLVFVVFIGTILLIALPPPSRRILQGQLLKSSDCQWSTLPADSDAYQNVAPFIFDSVHGLLKLWPSSYNPNGHSIVIATLAPNTLLYHAKTTPGRPGKPTFYALDPEMSVGIYGGSGHANLHVHSTTRSLAVLYFDGQSATLTPAGTLDSQMAVLQGHVPHYPSYQLLYNEDQRALDLCKLAGELKVDAIVRMNAGFEIIVCDASAAQVKEIFVTNITVPGNSQANRKNTSLPHDPNRQPPHGFGNMFSNQNSFEWLRSATWHYGHNSQGGGDGETRVKPDLCRIVSFYDPGLTSLAGSRRRVVAGNASFMNGWGLRRGHRLFHISRDDAELVRSWLRDITSDSKATTVCSGIDWAAVLTTIHAHHGTRAREIAATFRWKSETETQAQAIVTKIHELTHAILVPFVQYKFDDDGKDTIAKTQEQALARCKSVYTVLADPANLARSEKLIYHSINAVMGRLCDWEWDLFEWSEKRTTNYLAGGNAADDRATKRSLEAEISDYHKQTADVMEWVGWNTWDRCDRLCAADELCAIPTWPVIYAPGLPQGGIYASTCRNLTEAEMRDFWTPKCVNRADMDRGGGRGREPAYQFPDVDGGAGSG